MSTPLTLAFHLTLAGAALLFVRSTRSAPIAAKRNAIASIWLIDGLLLVSLCSFGWVAFVHSAMLFGYVGLAHVTLGGAGAAFAVDGVADQPLRLTSEADWLFLAQAGELECDFLS